MLYVSPFNAYGLWTPSEITTALWLDAADSSTITTVSGAVSEWRDKSGNGNHVSQATPSKRPTYLTEEVSFDGVDDMLVASSSILTTDFSGQFTLFSASTLVVGEAGYLYGAVDTDGTALYQNKETIAIANTLAGANANPQTHNINGKGVIGAIYNNQSVDYSFNGTIVNTNNSYTFASPTTNFTIANRQNGTAAATYWQGKHHEILIVSSAISQEIRQRLEGYLAHKWGLTANLPVDHPYKNTLPYV